MKPYPVTSLNSPISLSSTSIQNNNSDGNTNENSENNVQYDIYESKKEFELDPEFKKDDYMPYTYNIHDTMKQISNDLNNFNTK